MVDCNKVDELRPKNRMLAIAFFLIYSPVSFAQSINDPSTNLLLEEEIFIQKDLSTSNTDSVWDQIKYSIDYSRSDNRSSHHRAIFRIELDRSISSNVHLYVDNKVNYFLESDIQAERNDEAFVNNELQQLWFQYSLESCTIKGGVQNLIWGEIEGIYASDVITPLDYTEPFLTDFSSVRLAQMMLLSECYIDDIQTQIFYVPKAEVDRFFHRNDLFEGDTGTEWGGRLKISLKNADVKIMAARLVSNTPQLVLDSGSTRLDVAKFDMFGLGGSLAIDKLLLKADVAYKTDQLLLLSDETSDVLDVAIGFDYQTSSRHMLSSSLWRSNQVGKTSEPLDKTLYVLQWSKSYLRDDLSLSSVVTWSKEQEASTATVLAQYRWNDNLRTSIAVTINDEGDGGESNLSSISLTGGDQELAKLLNPPEETLFLSVNYQF